MIPARTWAERMNVEIATGLAPVVRFSRGVSDSEGPCCRAYG